MPTNFTVPGLTAQQTAALAGASLTVTIANAVFMITMWVLSCVALWHCFTRAGEKGWKAIIPFWRQYVMFRIAWDTAKFKSWLIPEIIACVGVIAYAVCANQPSFNWIFLAIGIIAYIVALVFIFKLYIRFAKAFGRTGALGVWAGICERIITCLYPVAIILFFVLAYGKGEYKGPQE